MFAALIFMLVGAGISIWAVHNHDQNLAIGGLILIGTVCVSWWFWVMFIIRSMINSTTKMIAGVDNIKTHITEIKILLQSDK